MEKRRDTAVYILYLLTPLQLYIYILHQIFLLKIFIGFLSHLLQLQYRYWELGLAENAAAWDSTPTSVVAACIQAYFKFDLTEKTYGIDLCKIGK